MTRSTGSAILYEPLFEEIYYAICTCVLVALALDRLAQATLVTELYSTTGFFGDYQPWA